MVRLFHAAIAALWLVAWWSWGIQALAILGRHGLLPLAEFFSQSLLHGKGSPWAVPSVFWLSPSDGAIVGAVALGMVSATLSLLGIAPKASLCVTAALYISFMAPAAPLLPGLGDRLLLEATGLLLLLPRDRPAPGMHLVARAMVFKLYIEVGLAQWFAPGAPWQQGLALKTLLESTPLPSPLAWYAAHLPEGALSLGTRLVVFVELFVPFFVFGPRTVRLVAAIVLTLLQVGVALLSNHGLFAWVAVALHLLLLVDADVTFMEADVGQWSPTLARWFGRLTRRVPLVQSWGLFAPWVARTRTRYPIAAPSWHRRVRYVAPTVVGTGYLLLSLAAVRPMLPSSFTQNRAGPFLAALEHAVGPWHLVNPYTRLGAPPAGRLEPEIEIMVHNRWQALSLWHQPQDPWRAPKFVAPHQPRLDVALSAYGRQGSLQPMPHFVGRLMETLCDEPQVLGRLVRQRIRPPVQSVRISLYSYRFSSWQEGHDTGAWWTREKIGSSEVLVCAER